MKELLINAAINELGYGQVAKNIIPELVKKGIKVYLVPIGKVPDDSHYSIKNALKNTETYNPNCKIPVLKIWHQHDLVINFPHSGPKFGFPFFELDTFSKKEKDSLNSINVLNASKWASDVLDKNGITTNTRKIVPLGYDPKIFKPNQLKGNNEIFKIANVGKWEIRKGHDVIPDIIKLAFKPDEIELHMCCTNPFLTKQEDEEWRNFYRKNLKDYQVFFYERFNEHVDLANFIKNMDCGLYPSRGEGWNLDALEFMACGVPVVVTDYSAHTEFVPEEYRVNSKYNIVPAFDGKWFFGQGNWAEHTDLQPFADKLVQIKNGEIENVTNKAKKYTWENTVDIILEVI